MKQKTLLFITAICIFIAFGAACTILKQSESDPPRPVLALAPPDDDGTGNSIDPALWKETLALHDRAIVIDTHCDTPSRMYYRDFDISVKAETGHFDLERMREGGLDAEFLIVWVPNSKDEEHPAKQALEELDLIYEGVSLRPDISEMAFSPEDIERLASQGKAACLIGMENGSPVESSVKLLRVFYRLGIRYCTLTHSKHNYICDSSFDEDPPRWNGISPFGKEMVQEMNRLGMIIDISHLSDKAIDAVLEETRAPVVDTHSGVRVLCPMERNRSDEQIKAIAERGGVLHINFGAYFLDKEWAERSRQLRAKMKELSERFKDDQEARRKAIAELRSKNENPPPPITALIDQIDHVVNLVGPDYVGIGSDFDGIGTTPRGLNSVADLPLITYHLLKRGYSEENILKILGGNFLRAFREVRNTAKRLKQE